MMQKRNILLLSISLTTLLFGAQPNIGDVMRQVEPPKNIPLQQEERPPFISEEEDEARIQRLYSGEKILIKRFFVTGAVHMSTEELRTLFAPYENKELTFGEMEAMASLLTKAYRENGYFVARAYLPKQDLFTQDGRLKINIIEGNYGNFNLKNNSLVSDEKVQAMLDDAKGDNVISTNTIERAMLIIGDTPGVKVAKADVKPGKEVGTSDFDIVTEATDPYSAYIIGDNYGSQYTGRYRTNIGISANSPLGYGDKFGINGVISTETDLKNGKVYYNFPLMANGLRGELSASHTSYALGDTYAALDAVGMSTTIEASIIYPFIRTRLETLNFTLSIAHKDMEDEVRSTSDSTKKEAMVAVVGANYSKESVLLGVNGKTTANIALSYGHLSFDNAADAIIDQAGPRTNGNYAKVSGIIEHYFQLDELFALTASVRFQKALGNKNLDGSEDFSVGGAYGVRAFPDGELSAENGYIFGAELFYTLPSYEGIQHKVSVFVDTGHASMENPTGATEDRHLSDVGIGYQVSYKNFYIKAQLAQVIGGEKVTSETPSSSTRALIQFGMVY